jgi:hypothetical protein
MGKLKKKVNINNKYVYVTLLSTWVLSAIFFLYIIINSIMYHEMQKSIPEQYKNKLIEAKMLLERTNKDVWNKDVFNANIKKAEDMIFEVRWKWVFLNDVNKLLSDISILKKQSNGIETFTMSQDKSQIEFKQKDFWINWIFEVSKKYYFIWKNSIIGPYIKWEPIKSYAYPDWEEVVAADVSPEGNVYLLTKTYRILEFYKQEFKYINVEWQKTWENSIAIKTFNWNLYLLSDKLNQIYRHKPGVNWFSAKSGLIEEKDSKSLSIVDYAIDGWFYILKKDLNIDKFFTTPEYVKRSIVINNVKANNYINNSTVKPKLYVWQNLNYIYELLDNKIWIFEADTKNYKDVKSLKYVWQLEPSEWEISAVYIPKDWTIYVWNKSWVYIIHFEVSDNKVIVR